MNKKEHKNEDTLSFDKRIKVLEEELKEQKTELNKYKNKVEMLAKRKKQLYNYKEAVESLAKKQENFEFINKDGGHAAVVLTSLVSNSKDIVRIFDSKLSGDLSGEVDSFNSLLPSLEEHLRLGRKLHVAILNPASVISNVYVLFNRAFS